MVGDLMLSGRWEPPSASGWCTLPLHLCCNDSVHHGLCCMVAAAIMSRAGRRSACFDPGVAGLTQSVDEDHEG